MPKVSPAEGRGANPHVTFGSNVISGRLSMCDLSSCQTVVTFASLTTSQCKRSPAEERGANR